MPSCTVTCNVVESVQRPQTTDTPVSALPLHAVVRTYFSRSSLLCTPAPGQPSSDRYLPRADCACRQTG